MKIIYFILPFFLIFLGCSSDDNVNYITINGKVERAINGDGIPNHLVTIRTRKSHGSGMFLTTEELDRKEVITDINGDFSVSLINVEGAFATITHNGGENYSSSSAYKNYPIDEPILIKVDKFIKFKILVNNTYPIDENDYIKIDFFAGQHQPIRTKIENFGIDNIYHQQEGSFGSWEETSWIGTNVNSIVYYSVPETAENYKIRWHKKKNGIDTDGFTSDIPYNINQVNSFSFEY